MQLRSLVLLVAVTGVSCSDGGGVDPPDAAPAIDALESDAELSPSCREALEHSDFTWLHDRIFNPTCANFTQCHDTVNSAGRLNMLSRDTAYAELLGPSFFFPSWNIVEPGSPEDSYLLVKLRCFSEKDELGESCEDGPIAIDGELMPPDADPLCKQKIDAIVRWIEAGAADD